MCNTLRHNIGGPGRGSKQDLQRKIARDNRATGSRTQKPDRREAPASLKSGEDNVLPTGKRHRYGDYEL